MAELVLLVVQNAVDQGPFRVQKDVQAKTSTGASRVCQLVFKVGYPRAEREAEHVIVKSEQKTISVGGVSGECRAGICRLRARVYSL